MDRLTREARSRVMQGIRSKHTKPELVVRRFLHREGFRYSLHPRKLPGRPDVVLVRHRIVVDVRGCFWHRHGCSNAGLPASRAGYWRKKLEANAARDRRNVRSWRKLGWDVYVVWECEDGPKKLRRLVGKVKSGLRVSQHA